MIRMAGICIAGFLSSARWTVNSDTYNDIFEYKGDWIKKAGSGPCNNQVSNRCNGIRQHTTMIQLVNIYFFVKYQNKKSKKTDRSIEMYLLNICFLFDCQELSRKIKPEIDLTVRCPKKRPDHG